jgi:hypothetical protein
MFGTDDKRRQAKRANSKIVRRVRKTATDDLMLWADQVMVSTYQAFRSWQNTSDSDMLSEAVMGSEALREVMLEIQRRNGPFG